MKKRKVILGGLGLGAVTFLLGALIAQNAIRPRPSRQLFCKSNLKNIGAALELYSLDNDGKYPRNLNLLTPNYLKTIPQCPEPESLGYFAEFGLRAAINTAGFQDYYYLSCIGTGHEKVSVGRNYPAYDGIQGLIERP